MKLKPKKRIYLDYAASTPILPEVLVTMVDFYKNHYGNPLAIYQEGRDSLAFLESSREKIAKIINCKSNEIIFTNGGTEADNLAIFGVARAYKHLYKKPRIIASKIEHVAILNALHQLEKEGFEIKLIDVDKYGMIDLEKLEKTINNQTILISIIYSSNEIGTIQPLSKIAQLIKKYRKNIQAPPFLHTDASADFMSFNIQKLNVDLMTINGGKLGGPKATGALFVRQGIDISPLIFGGNQENGRRSGTENLPGIVGFAKAIEISQKRLITNTKKISQLRDFLIKLAIKEISGLSLNGHPKNRLPNNVHFTILGIEGESLVLMLDRAGIATSTGSACNSKTLQPSHILKALGLPLEIIHGSLRITIGSTITKKEIKRFIKELKKAVHHLRSLSAVNWKDLAKKFNK